ncbi:hypothetical protein K1719_026743 [Acacia pycnantha]|nr:hypothetical protein K1719_026743 [Acacia pycnantha]
MAISPGRESCQNELSLVKWVVEGDGTSVKVEIQQGQANGIFLLGHGNSIPISTHWEEDALTKVACFVTTDDVYDVYGTLDELEPFTAAVERYKAKERNLLDHVWRMIVNENTEPLAKLELIDDVQRLGGLGYRFDKEIKDALHTYVSQEETCRRTEQSISLHEAALSFRLLRDHGYHSSPEIFESFKDQNGNFKACLSNDVKGMLSLYEATFLGHQGEDILEEAKAFTTTLLSDMNQHTSNDHVLSQAISHALDLPVHRRTRRLEARWYIDAYGQRKDANMVLLEAAMLDFNIVQSTLQKDLQEMSRWWKAIGLASKLSFSRDRLMECFFWAVGIASEPKQTFTAAVERWDINAIHVLPKYMKVCFLALYNTVNEMTYEALKEQGHNILPTSPKHGQTC